MALDRSLQFLRGPYPSHFFFGIETSQAILKRPPVKVVTKSVTIPTIITTAMILVNENSVTKIWDGLPKDNFLKKSTRSWLNR